MRRGPATPKVTRRPARAGPARTRGAPRAVRVGRDPPRLGRPDADTTFRPSARGSAPGAPRWSRPVSRGRTPVGRRARGSRRIAIQEPCGNRRAAILSRLSALGADSGARRAIASRRRAGKFYPGIPSTLGEMPRWLAPSGIPSCSLLLGHDHKDTDDPDDEGLGDDLFDVLGRAGPAARRAHAGVRLKAHVSRRPAGAGNFLKLRRSLDEHLLFRRMTWNEFAMFVWLCLRANPADGVIRTSWPQLEIETHLSAKHAEQICRALRRKRYVWYPWHRGRRGQHRLIEVAINKYPTADGRYTDLSARFPPSRGSQPQPALRRALRRRRRSVRRVRVVPRRRQRNWRGIPRAARQSGPNSRRSPHAARQSRRNSRGRNARRIPASRHADPDGARAGSPTPTRDELAPDPTRRAAIRIELALDPTPARQSGRNWT